VNIFAAFSSQHKTPEEASESRTFTPPSSRTGANEDIAHTQEPIMSKTAKTSFQRSARVTWVGFVAFAAVSVGWICPSLAEDCTPKSVDLGGASPVQTGCGKLNIAFLSMGTNNTYLQAGIKGAKDAAAEVGATVEVFDGGWTPATQYNQVQNILSSGKYNAILGEMVDGRQACKILSDEAPKKNILVAISNNPLCGKDTMEGDSLWTPGTITFVGGSQQRPAFRDWIFSIAKQNPGPQKVILVTGPELLSNTVNTKLAIKDVQEKYPDFKVVAELFTDYSLPQAYQKAVPALQANPDATIIIACAGDLTRGAVQAAQQANWLSSLKIYDGGGNTWAFQAVKDGTIVSTRVLTPYTEMYAGIKAIDAAWKGEKVGHFTPLETTIYTRDTIGDTKPQY
jgi:ribose transport system substrate-binding protein